MNFGDDFAELEHAVDDLPLEERVLVAVITRPADWERVLREHWYRIPVSRAPRRLGAEYLAFYHTKAFDDLRWKIAYYAPIQRYRIVLRRELLPDEPDHPRADERYYRLELGPLVALPHPIVSPRLRRIAFIHTTLARLLAAREINDLWTREGARDHLRRALQAREIPSYADYLVEEGMPPYRADLAVLCVERHVAILCSDEREGRLAEMLARYEAPGLWPRGRSWLWQRFTVAEIMTDVGRCVAVIEALVRVAGGLCPVA